MMHLARQPFCAKRETMNIIPFDISHLEQAHAIASDAYARQRAAIPALPDMPLPDLTPFARDGEGFAAVEDGRLLGFLCAYPPFENAFGTTGVRGIHVPLHAHGAVGARRAQAYEALYQAAAQAWVNAGALSHSISIYSHDADVQQLFFRYSFGMRLADAIRSLDPIGVKRERVEGYTFRELAVEEYAGVHPLENALRGHLGKSPTFMRFNPLTPGEFLKENAVLNPRFFVAEHAGQIVAYYRITQAGETFLTEAADMPNITGAYCLEEHRGCGVSTALLDDMMAAIKAEGNARLGVDYETINPTAWGFWGKYFLPYDVSLVRRIDEGGHE